MRWRPLECLDVLCELQSPHPHILQRATQLLCIEEPDAHFAARQILRWHVARREPGDHENKPPWSVRELHSGITYHVSEENHALMLIEYSVVRSLVACVRAGVYVNHALCEAAPPFAFHGALLCREDFGLIVVGPSEAGKSTLSCALWQAGWSLLSDDFCFVQAGEQAAPAGRRVSLRNSSRTLLGEKLWTRIRNAPSSSPTGAGWLFHPHELDGTRPARRQAVPLKALVLLRRDTGSETAAGLIRSNPARAAISLLPYSTLLPQCEEDAAPVLDWGVGLPRIAPLTARVPLYELGRGPLEQMVAAVNSLADS